MATPYTPVLIWASAAAKDIYIRERGDVKSGLIEGVMSCWAQDIYLFDGQNYRDKGFPSVLSGGYNQAFVIADGTESVEALPFVSGESYSAADYLAVVKEDDSDTSWDVEKFALAGAHISANDDQVHIPPRNERKKRTMLEFWSTAGGEGTGNCLYQCWADRFISYEASDTAPTFIT